MASAFYIKADQPEEPVPVTIIAQDDHNRVTVRTDTLACYPATIGVDVAFDLEEARLLAKTSCHKLADHFTRKAAALVDAANAF